MFAGELGDGVDAARIRKRVLVVWLGRIAVEHVVGADVHEAGARLGAALGEPLDGARVHGEGAVLLALAHLDVVEGGAVDDERRAERLERVEDRLVVGDVESGVGGRADLGVLLEQPPRRSDASCPPPPVIRTRPPITERP